MWSKMLAAIWCEFPSVKSDGAAGAGTFNYEHRVDGAPGGRSFVGSGLPVRAHNGLHLTACNHRDPCLMADVRGAGRQDRDARSPIKTPFPVEGNEKSSRSRRRSRRPAPFYVRGSADSKAAWRRMIAVGCAAGEREAGMSAPRR